MDSPLATVQVEVTRVTMDFPVCPLLAKLGLAVLASASLAGGDGTRNYISIFFLFTFVGPNTTEK